VKQIVNVLNRRLNFNLDKSVFPVYLKVMTSLIVKMMTEQN